MKLSTKVNILSTFLTSIILIGSFTGIYFLYKELAYTTEAEQLQERSFELATAISSLATTQDIDTVFRAYIPTDGAIFVKDTAGKNLIRLQTTSKNIEFAPHEEEHYSIQTIDDIPHIALATPMIWPDQQVVETILIQPLPTIPENLSRLKLIFVLMTLIALLPIFFAGQLLIRYIVKPVQQMTDTMEHNIRNSSFEQINAKKRSKDELANMANTYNELMAQIEQQHERQQQFVGNASHELKTPLTVIESYAKLLNRRGTENKEITKEALTAIIGEAENMKAMIEQMLALAKTSEMTIVTNTKISLQPFLQAIAHNFHQAYYREVHVECPEIELVSDEAKLKQLLFIFLDNARKYSEQEISITVQRLPKNNVEIQIIDQGVGIPRADIPHLFQRFYRVDKDRNRKTGGVGIGLSIAHEIAKQLLASIHVKSDVGQGTTISIKIPLNGGQKNEYKA
ncbi:HAMP domain-containing sensor histidine kinase [Solibacillus sp. FSL R7-0682]|uniref:sensor histidine kinase n=1 Tax=Solibacillus sp. FSL R7-0682 TaxID=2921690 RepID=UPI0030F92623